MNQPISKEAINQLFTEARSHHGWQDHPVSDEVLHGIYDLMKWAPTSVNAAPARIMFVRSKEERERLVTAVMPGNVDQVRSASVVAVIAYDEKFYEELPTLFPAYDAKPMFLASPALSESTAFRNSSLQGAYFMLAARAMGLDVGPMSGFDNSKVDELFLKGTSWKSNFICAIGHGDASKLYARGPRLEFDVVCRVV